MLVCNKHKCAFSKKKKHKWHSSKFQVNQIAKLKLVTQTIIDTLYLLAEDAEYYHGCEISRDGEDRQNSTGSPHQSSEI